MKSHSKTFIFMQLNFKNIVLFAIHCSFSLLNVSPYWMKPLIFILWCPLSLKYLITLVILPLYFFWALYIILSPCLWVSEDKGLFFCLFSMQYFKSFFTSIISILCIHSFPQNAFQSFEYVWLLFNIYIVKTILNIW